MRSKYYLKMKRGRIAMQIMMRITFIIAEECLFDIQLDAHLSFLITETSVWSGKKKLRREEKLFCRSNIDLAIDSFAASRTTRKAANEHILITYSVLLQIVFASG